MPETIERIEQILNRVNSEPPLFLPDYEGDIDSYSLQEQENLKKHLENNRYEEDTKNRAGLALWVKWVVSIWLFVVLLIICLNNLIVNLSDRVLITLLATTTLNVLGLAFIVLRGYFQDINKK